MFGSSLVQWLKMVPYLLVFIFLANHVLSMPKHEMNSLRDEAREMFYHAYNAYLDNAYPADELMPLSCKGRYRGLTPSRGDIDDSLGNYSLTLIDTLDTLVIMGDVKGFEKAVKMVIRDVSFNNNVIVSVFETNIRVLGGLLSAHILADLLQQQHALLSWYNGELLNLAVDLGYRLLPAFNSTTGIPHARVNLKYGLTNGLEYASETCTACAGSMILEMAALSRLSGEPIFEIKAHKAMDELWNLRHRTSDLMGTVLNVNSGDWIRKDSGVGAGLDSYYEYCLKAYILLGDETYLTRFNRHYNAIMKYVSQGPMLLDVHMHRPYTNSRNYMDALLAFWPGLQVLKGDLKPAVETHEMLYQILQKHTFLPEAFTVDFQVYWSNHPLRPEFLESTYFLYTATKDPYYLEVGKTVLNNLQAHARVRCGFAAFNDVRTRKSEDRMDSFVLSETLKYLYLLFVDKQDLIINIDEFIFTTEGHLFPLSLGSHQLNGRKLLQHLKGNTTSTDVQRVRSAQSELEDESDQSVVCPTTANLMPANVRLSLRDIVHQNKCSASNEKSTKIRTGTSILNSEHIKLLKDLGVNVISTKDGRIRLIQPEGRAILKQTADGIIIMHQVTSSNVSEMLPILPMQSVSFAFDYPGSWEGIFVSGRLYELKAGPAQFGVHFRHPNTLSAPVFVAYPGIACSKADIASIVNRTNHATTNSAPSNVSETKIFAGRIVVVQRGGCMFAEKARLLEGLGAVGVIVVDNEDFSNQSAEQRRRPEVFTMSGDGRDDITIPVVFLTAVDAMSLMAAVIANPHLAVTLGEWGKKNDNVADSGGIDAPHVTEMSRQRKFAEELVEPYVRKSSKNGVRDLKSELMYATIKDILEAPLSDEEKITKDQHPTQISYGFHIARVGSDLTITLRMSMIPFQKMNKILGLLINADNLEANWTTSHKWRTARNNLVKSMLQDAWYRKLLIPRVTSIAGVCQHFVQMSLSNHDWKTVGEEASVQSCIDWLKDQLLIGYAQVMFVSQSSSKQHLNDRSSSHDSMKAEFHPFVRLNLPINDNDDEVDSAKDDEQNAKDEL